MKTGVATLPLHFGKAPAWLFDRMRRLSREIVLAIVKEYGPEEVLRRLSDPYWFQSLGCVLGFDWHSSGVTTTVCGALKEGLKGLEKDTGIFIAGGKGGTSRRTPSEIEDFFSRFGINGKADNFVYASRMSAKVDSTALQDGYQLYQHNFMFTKSGLWTVIQQGMNTATRRARRYHWLSEGMGDFVCEPHAAVCCDHKGKPLNMVARESGEAREAVTVIAGEKPIKVITELKKIKTLRLPEHHSIFLEDLRIENLSRVLLTTYENQPKNFEGVLITPGLGPKTLRALSLISELVYGKKPSYKDPVKFSFAHGGKDGHPYPVNRDSYDRSIQILRKALQEARIGRSEKLDALKRLF